MEGEHLYRLLLGPSAGRLDDTGRRGQRRCRSRRTGAETRGGRNHQSRDGGTPFSRRGLSLFFHKRNHSPAMNLRARMEDILINYHGNHYPIDTTSKG